MRIHGNKKNKQLTDEQIQSMQLLYKTLPLIQIAELYGVSISHAQYMIGRKPRPPVTKCALCKNKRTVPGLPICKKCFAKAGE